MNDNLGVLTAQIEWKVSIRLKSRNDDMPSMPADEVAMSLSNAYADGMLHPLQLIARDMATLINGLIKADLWSCREPDIEWMDIGDAFTNALDQSYVDLSPEAAKRLGIILKKPTQS